MSSQLGEALIPIRLTLEKFQEDTKQARGKLASFVSSASKAAIVGAAGAITAVGAAGIAAGVEITKFAESFDDATNALIVGTGATGETLASLENVVKNLKSGTGGLGQEFGNLGAVVAEVNTRTGATGKTLEDFSKSVLDMTRLTGGDGVRNTQLITRVMGDWGVEMQDSQALMDTLFGAGQAFGIGVENLSQKVVQFGAPLRQMGFTLEESIALFGKWEKEGVNAELAIGSLRIAAGKFAKGNDEGSKELEKLQDKLGGAQDKLQKYQDQLTVLTVKQSEYTDKTKESVKVKDQLKFEELTGKIEEQQGVISELNTELENIPTPTLDIEGQKSLQENLNATMEAIKNASSESEALSIAMETFGARAGPDMAAAIREGRFELDSAIESLQGTQGGLDDASERALKFGERLEIMKSKTLVALMPIGEAFIGLAEDAMPAVSEFLERAQPVFQDFAATFKEKLGPAMMIVNDALTRIFGAMGATSEEVTLMDVGIAALKITLDLIITALEFFAITMHGIAFAVEAVSSWVKIVSGDFDEWKKKLAEMDLPDWLVPGSPTPLELGLRGITDAMGHLPELGATFDVSAAGAVADGGGIGGDTTIINIDGVSASSQGGVEDVIALVVDMLRAQLERD